ncbi:MAG: hypothetical protein AB7T06_25250 [Kofleriaceae bacterium]
MTTPDDKDASDTDKSSGSSGSIDISTDSSSAIPAVADTATPASSSGSIDVAMSGPTPKVSDGTPTPVAALETGPVARTKRLTDAAKSATSTVVSAVGTGIDKLGEGVSYIGEASKGVPIVGAGVSALGETIQNVGESIESLPRVARTRRGRLLFRSLIVGFFLVATWIVVIVALQVKGSDTPDFRPIAEKILVGIASGPEGIERVYDNASPRFQEMVRKEKFADEMADLAATVGKFKEITAVNESLVTRGPTGRVGRVLLTVAYEKAKCKASVSVHEDKGEWKLLGVGIELPPELAITQAQREERVQACKDPMAKTCDLNAAATKILEQLRDGKYEQVWDEATQVFQKQEEKMRFVGIQREHAQILGNFIRILAVTEARVIGGTNATFDVISEYTRSNGVRAIFTFYRGSKTRPWKLRSLKIVLPMPRADEQPLAEDANATAGSNSSAIGTP